MTLEKKAQAFDILRKLCGYVENGTSDTVKIYQDDATKSWFVKVGKTESFGDSLYEAICNAGEIDDET